MQGIQEYTRYKGYPGEYLVYWVPREEPTEDGLTSSYATILDPLGYNIPGPDTVVHIQHFGESVKLIKYVYTFSVVFNPKRILQIQRVQLGMMLREFGISKYRLKP